MPGERDGIKLPIITGDAIALIAESQPMVLRRKRPFTQHCREAGPAAAPFGVRGRQSGLAELHNVIRTAA